MISCQKGIHDEYISLTGIEIWVEEIVVELKGSYCDFRVTLPGCPGLSISAK